MKKEEIMHISVCVCVCVGMKDICSTLRFLLSYLSLCGILSEPTQWHFQAAELWDLSVSPSVVISDCYSPDDDALAL